jgi:hypothetical protein
MWHDGFDISNSVRWGEEVDICIVLESCLVLNRIIITVEETIKHHQHVKPDPAHPPQS